MDHPSEKSFFRFLPSLLLQKQRNNFVYNQDLVIISSTYQLLHHYPTLYTNYGESNLLPGAASVNNPGKKALNGGNKVIANIEDTKKWRLNLYQFQTNDDQEINNFLRIGDACWLNLSEKNYYLTASLEKDPFEKRVSEEKKTSASPSPQKSSALGVFDFSETNQPNELSFSSLDDDQENDEDNFYQNEIISNLVLRFEETSVKKTSKSTEYVEMATSGLWKIEPQNIFEGGYLTWESPYKFRHLTSGRYLKVETKENEVYYIGIFGVQITTCIRLIH